MAQRSEAIDLIYDDDSESELEDIFGTEDVDLEDDGSTTFVYDESSLNLVEAFMDHPDGRKGLSDLAEKVYDDHTQAHDSMADYRQRQADDWKLIAGELPPKTFPHSNSANAHVPLALENLTRLTSRVEAELFGDYKRFYGVVPLSAEDEGVAEILTLHGNWQLRNEIKDFSRQMSRAIMSFFIFGDVCCHSYYNRRRKRNVHEILTCDDFIIPYVHVSTMPDYSDCPFYVKVLRLYRHEVEAEKGNWYGVEELLKGDPPGWEDDPEATFRDSAIETTHIIIPDDTSRSTYQILQYEGWVMLPNQEEERFVQVIMDYESRHILSLHVHEEDDWEDRIRHDREWKELEAYRDASERFPIETAQWDRQQTLLRQDSMDPTLGETGMQVSLQDAAALEAPIKPQPPVWVDKDDPDPRPAPPKRVPVHMFSHGVCIENMAGSMGLSFGRMQADHNRTANVLTAQFIDAATMANCWSLICTDQVRFDTDFELMPGKINKVSGLTGQSLKDNMMELKPAPANPQHMQMVDKVVEWAAASIQSNAVLSGESGKSGETYRGHASRLEQATKQISVPARKFSNTFLRQVLTNNGRLNAVYLEESQIIQVVDMQNPRMRAVRVDRQMYARNYQVEVHADLRFTSEGQRVQERMELIQLPAVVPPLAQNMAWQYGALVKYLEARNDIDMIELLGEAPERPSLPFGTPPQPPPGAVPGAIPGNTPGAVPGGGEGPAPPAGTPGPGGVAPGPPVPQNP